MKTSSRLIGGGLALAAFASACAIFLGSSACFACTEVGCGDGFSATLRTADDSWPTGDYTIDVSADGKKAHCTFSWDGAVAASGFPDVSVTCDPPAMAEFDARLSVTTTMDKNGTKTSGTPIPGKFEVVVGVPGTPKSVTLDIARDGTSLGHTTVQPEYQSVRPNGFGCGPTCSDASTTWKL